MHMTPKEVYQDQLQLKSKMETKDIFVETKRKLNNLYVKAGEIKRTIYSKQHDILFVFKEALMNLTDLALVLLCEMIFLLHEYQDVFPKYNPKGLPPICHIEYQINFVPV